MAPLGLLFLNPGFSLNAWGLAGIFGGEEAIASVALIPLYQGRRWLGWYNFPGSLEVARHFGRLAHSRYWEGKNPYTTKSPARLFGLDGRVGPKYSAAFSGTEMQTGHLGYLVVERCKEVREVTEIQGRTTMSSDVALLNLTDVNYDTSLRLSRISTFLAFVPIIVSVVMGIMCALVFDWYSFSTIMVGIFASGFASATIGGSASLFLESVKNPADGSPPGDGILVPVVWEGIVVVIKGKESAVNAITKGKFKLELGGRTFQYAIVMSALLLIVETLAQLFLIPQGSLFGQVMFVISLCVSWAYNFRISLLNKERLQADILFQKLSDPPIRKFLLGTRTTMAVFVTLLVFGGVSKPPPMSVQQMLRTFLPNDTDVWKKWRDRVTGMVCERSPTYLEAGDGQELTEPERNLLNTLLDDARAAYEGYLQNS